MMVHKDWDSSDSKLPWFQIRGACSKWANLPSVLGSCCDVFSLVPTIESIPPWRPWATAQPQRTAKSIQAHHTQNHPRKKDALHQFNPISGWALGPRLHTHWRRWIVAHILSVNSPAPTVTHRRGVFTLSWESALGPTLRKQHKQLDCTQEMKVK